MYKHAIKGKKEVRNNG